MERARGARSGAVVTRTLCSPSTLAGLAFCGAALVNLAAPSLIRAAVVCGDVNGDGVVNIGDALKIAQCDVGLISCAFTCGPFVCSSTTTTEAPTTTTTATSTSTTTTVVACHFPATGQTTCWDSSGTAISCAGTGQDGDFRKGAPLSYTDNGNG